MQLRTTNPVYELNTIFCPQLLKERLRNIREPLHLLKDDTTQHLGCLLQSEYEALYSTLSQTSISHIGILPAIYPEWLGSSSFLTTHHARFPYIIGEMANGIATARMVIAAARAGMVGFFGAAGLMPDKIEKNILDIQQQLGQQANWGVNLIHSPQEPQLEEAAVNLFLKYGVKRVSASAYMSLSPHVVHYASKGLRRDPQGAIVRDNHVLAKISRPEVAKHFMSPPPHDLLAHLVQSKKITEEEASLARLLPIAEDITVEADSGGHTDNRPLTALFPTIQQLAGELSQQYGYLNSIRIGAAGGIGTPSAVAAAFALGADYVLTGSINQSAVESGLSYEGRMMLAQAGIADVAMAPAADMFELGVKLQVLKRGTLFVGRANKLYELYSHYNSLEAIPATEVAKIEKEIFRASLDEIWQTTQEFFSQRDPEQLHKAKQNPKHRMALVFRWYLGLSSQWAIQGNPDRQTDYQIWCGPAMGAFNQWIAGTSLADINQRTVEQIGRNLLEGAAIISRAQQLRSMGMPITAEIFSYLPQLLA